MKTDKNVETTKINELVSPNGIQLLISTSFSDGISEYDEYTGVSKNI